jgi:hypothetical protein
MRRIWIVLSSISCLLLIGGTGTAAQAAKPIIEKGGDTVVDFHFPAGTVCSFPLDVHQELKVTFKTFVDANGDTIRSISTGSIHDWETNVRTGETQFFSIPGPSFFDATGALVRGTGAWSGVQLQDGTWVRIHGMITFDENLLVETFRGHLEPLCDSFA